MWRLRSVPVWLSGAAEALLSRGCGRTATRREPLDYDARCRDMRRLSMLSSKAITSAEGARSTRSVALLIPPAAACAGHIHPSGVDFQPRLRASASRSLTEDGAISAAEQCAQRRTFDILKVLRGLLVRHRRNSKHSRRHYRMRLDLFYAFWLLYPRTVNDARGITGRPILEFLAVVSVKQPRRPRSLSLPVRGRPFRG